MEKYPQAFEKPECARIELVTKREQIQEVESIVKSHLRKKGQPEEWAEVGIVFQDAYMTILRDAVRFQPNNNPGTYIRSFSCGKAPGVVVFPMLDGQVCLLNIFRHALRMFTYEVPRGFGINGQTDEQNAIRELQEEIGGDVKNLYPLGHMNENSGLGDGQATLFFAELEGPLNVSEHEEGIDKVMLVPVEEFMCMIRDGKINDSFTLAATVRALLQGYLKV